MTPANALCDEIRSLFGSSLGLEIPSFDTDLIDAGLLDSMSFVELLLQIEKNFHIMVAFDDIELKNFRSVETIARFVASHSAVN